METNTTELWLYKASAGSGKTYRLTQAFVQLLIGQPGKYDQLMAVTFTNKATAEMKDRILKELYLLSVQSGKADHKGHLKKELKMSDDQLAKLAQDAMGKLLHDYSHFNISTIDSFFQSVLRSFARELGMRSAFDIELDQNAVLDELTDELMLSTATDEELLRWLEAYAEQRVEEEKHWDFRGDISRLGREIFMERFNTLDPQLMDELADRGKLETQMNAVRKYQEDFRGKLRALAQQGMSIMGNHGLSVVDFTYGKNGPAGYLQKLAEKGAEPKTPGKRATGTRGNPDAWMKKNSPKEAQIRAAVAAGLGKKMDRILDIFESDEYRSYITAELVSGLFHTTGILSDLMRLLQEWYKENNRYLIAESNQLINQIIYQSQVPDVPFVYEKTGAWLSHIMIDEFQDTSRLQWQNLAPLLLECLSRQTPSLIVGDEKQAIYRFRNSDWRILAGEFNGERFGPARIRKENLDTNWRSSAMVVDFNNELFKHAAAHLDNKLNDEIPMNNEEGAQELRSAYASLQQKVPEKKKAMPGYVDIHYYENDKDDDKDENLSWEDKAERDTARLIDRLLANAYQPSDICLLVRTGKEAGRITRYLLQHQRENPGTAYQVISEKALEATASPAVRLLLNALRYMADRADTINQAELVDNYNRCHGKEAGALRSGGLCKQAAIKMIDSELNRLSIMPLYEATEEFIRLFGLGDMTEHIPYLTAFQEMVHHYTNTRAGTAEAFLEWQVNTSQGKNIVLGGEHNALNVMTIHKSKGLQFNTVILPYMNWEVGFKNNFQPLVWSRIGRAPFTEISYLPAKCSSKMAKSWFAESYREEMVQTYADNLNLMYVAFTRPEQNLIAMCPVRENNRKPYGVADLVEEILKDENKRPAGMETTSDPIFLSQKRYSLGKEQEKYVAPKTGADDKTTAREVYKEKIISKYLSQPGHDIHIRAQAGRQDAGKADKQMSMGRLMHRILEDVITIDDIGPALDKAIREGRIPRAGKDEYQNKISQAIVSDTRLTSWFGGGWKVYTEQAILSPGGLLRQPDRVLVSDNEVIVIDFKFGQHESDKYHVQVRQYMEAIPNRENKALSGYLWYFELGKLVEVKLEDLKP